MDGRSTPQPTTAGAAVLDAIIIGSGFGGICQAIKFKEHGIDSFLILEKASDLGGIWRDNTYPGAECDVPSLLYSYSFEAKRSYESYLGQPAILDYIREVADKHKVTKHICYSQTVSGLKYNEEAHNWSIHTMEGGEYTARFVISAVGQLHHPSIPKFAGCSEFQGESLHTAQFGSKKLDHFIGKRVAVIGSGASAIQLVPELQKVCDQVHLYQRTPSYVLPKLGLSSVEEMILGSHRILRNVGRAFVSWVSELLIFSAISGKAFATLSLQILFNLNLSCNVNDAKKRESLKPHYPIGAKRILVSAAFYPAMDQPNVQINSIGIKGMTKGGIINLDDSHTEVDTIVYATGFITNPFLYKISVIGKSNKELWKDGKGDRAYLGVATSGFPNLFFLYGPNTNTGHSSVILFVEEQIAFILRAMHYVKNTRHKSIEVKEYVEGAFNEDIQKGGKELSFTKVKNSWYLQNEKLVNNWTSTYPNYRKSLSDINISKQFDLDGNDPDGSGILINFSIGANEVERTRGVINTLHGLLETIVRIPVFAMLLASQGIRVILTLVRSKIRIQV